MPNNVIMSKSKSFALRVVKLYKYLCEEKHEYVLSKQLLRSGTSIGANIRESKHGESQADFYHKLNISLKEAEETAYWLELLHESEYLTKKEFNSIYNDCNECIALLISIIKHKNENLNEIKKSKKSTASGDK